MLNKKALLVKVGVHKPSLQKKAKNVLQTAAKEYEVSEDLMRVMRDTFVKEDVNAIKKLMNKVLPTVYKYTLPYRDGGWRLLPVDIHAKLEEELRDIAQELAEAKIVFVENYDSYKENAKNRLGKLFDPLDYPPAERLMDKFMFDTTYEPIPEADNIRVDMDKEVVEELKQELRDKEAKRFERATKEVWNKVIAAVQRLYDRLSAQATTDEDGEEKKPRIFKSVISDIRNIIDILPALNLNNDPKMESIRKKLDEEFAYLDVEDLKTDEDLKKETAKKAEELLEEISNIL